MKSLTRRVLIATALMLGLGAPSRAAEVDPLIPADAESIVYFNFKQILESEIIKKYALEQLKQAMQGNDAQKMMKDLGLDPMKDIEKLTLALWGEDPQNMKGVFILRGKFNPEKLFASADAESKKNPDKLSLVKHGKYTFVKIANENGQGVKEVYISVGDDKTLIGSTDKEILATAMGKVESGTTKSEAKKALAGLMVKMDEKASMFMVGLSTGKIGDIPANPLFDDPAKLKKQLEKMENFTLTLRVGEDVTMDATMGMKDTDSADDFAGSVDELLGKVRAFLPLIAGQQPNLKPLISDLTKNLKSKAKDKDVVITMKLAGKSIAAAAGAGD